MIFFTLSGLILPRLSATYNTSGLTLFKFDTIVFISLEVAEEIWIMFTPTIYPNFLYDYAFEYVCNRTAAKREEREIDREGKIV